MSGEDELAAPLEGASGLHADERIRGWAEGVYRHLHAHPELSMQERETANSIEQRLDELGIDHFRCGGTGVVGVIRNGDGRIVAFRAETDALPMLEATGLPYASVAAGVLPDGSTSAVMHACGHDLHMAALLGAAAVLVEHTNRWSGTVILVFQPGEETAAGARAMLQDGLWERAPKPQVVMAQHSYPHPLGSAHLPSRTVMAMADSIRVTLRGTQTHGSQPQTGIDPILLGSHVVTRLQGVVSREVDPRDPVVLTVGTFHAGFKENIIPERADLTVNVRTMDPATRDRVLAAIQRVVMAEAAASGAPAPVLEVFNSFPPCINDPVAAERVRGALVKVFGPDGVTDPAPVMGSEDAGLLWDAIGVPGVYWFLGVAATSDADPPMNHSPMYAPTFGALDAAIDAALAAIGAWVC